MRSLLISQHTLGTNHIAVYHHTGCGVFTFNDDGLRKKIRDYHADKDCSDLDTLNFMGCSGLDLEQSVRDDVKFLQDCPLLVKDTTIEGWVWDITKSEVRGSTLIQFSALTSQSGPPGGIACKEPPF